MDGKQEDRRLSPRVNVPYPARIWCPDTAGRLVKEDAYLDNLSSGGVYLRQSRSIGSGTQVAVAVRLSTAEEERRPALRLVARGMVVRTERLTDGKCGVAVEFTRRRVL